MEFSDQAELVKEYIEDSIDFLNEFDNMLLQLEPGIGQEHDPALIHEILSQLHTFKGNSGMMGYSSLQKYTHKLEDLFKALQSANISLDEDLLELVMQSASVIRNKISGISPKKSLNPALKNDISRLEKFIAANLKSNQPSTPNYFERLDQLMNLMGELVIHRTRLGQIDGMFKKTYGEKGLNLELSDTAEQIGKISTELHEAIMKVRMLPVKNVFMRFPRFVRDFARERGKEINIQFEGQDTELDKTVIDEIGEPLMHLVRNAIDHGIETPGERKDLGKPSQGNIFMRAYQESSHFIIEVKDDGRGINEESLKKGAERAGLLQGDENQRRNLMDLMMLPGLSTAKTVTEVSGRGLGMDVVIKSLAKINGTIEVESEINAGTRFTIKLPLTLAIISALMIETANEQYAIPLGAVIKNIKINSDEIHKVNNREVVNVRDQVLPLVRLAGLFSPDGSRLGKNHTEEESKISVVVVQGTSEQIGIIVDSFLGQQEIVVKALDELIRSSVGIAGATILGDGKVVLIVDVAALVEKYKLQGSGKKRNEVKHA
jgi:two-component system chemotaxis sensor kinase CheA